MNKEHLQDTKQNLGDWSRMWEKAQEEGVFNDDTSNGPEALPFDPKTCDLAGLPTAPSDITDQADLLQERKTPNPVFPDSVGVDQQQPEPVWVSEDMLKEIEDLKEKLFKLENKFAEKSGKFVDQASGDKKMMSQIESIRKQIEQVSSSLGVENEPSPWETDENE